MEKKSSPKRLIPKSFLGDPELAWTNRDANLVDSIRPTGNSTSLCVTRNRLPVRVSPRRDRFVLLHWETFHRDREEGREGAFENLSDGDCVEIRTDFVERADSSLR